MLQLSLVIALLAPPTGPGARFPNLSPDGDGALLTWFEPTEAGHALRYARWEAGRFSPARTIHAADDFVVNWADFPSLFRGGDGALWAHFPIKSGSAKYAYDVRLARAGADGTRWELLGPAHDDGTQTEHGFPSLWAAPGGMEAVWLDGRETARKGPMTLRWGRFGAERGGGVIDPRVCDCCGTSAAAGFVAYRDRANGEIRDIKVARRVDGEWRISVVHDDGWRMPGCPVNGPAVAAQGQRVAVAWFTAAGGRARVRVAFSDDGAASFGPPIDIDAAQPLGRVDLELDPKRGDALVSWLARSGLPAGHAEVKLRRVAPSGKVGAALVVGPTIAGRASGFPRMVRVGEELLLTWNRCARDRPAKTACDGVHFERRSISAVPAAVGVAETAPPAALVNPADYEAADLQGRARKLPAGPVLVSLWASWCKPCKAELAALATLKPGAATVVAISVDAEVSAARAHAESAGYPFLVLHDAGAQATFGAAAIPATRLFGADGALRWAHDGRAPPGAIAEALKKR